MNHDWQQILADFGPAVWRTVKCLVGNEADARDCYQVVFMQAFQFAQENKVQDWSGLLGRIARMRALDHLRTRYRRAAHVDSSATTDLAISPTPGPAAELECIELAQRLREGIGQLTPQQSEAFVLRFVDQLSYDEIAEQTNSTRNAVGVLLNRARKQLRDMLTDECDSDIKENSQ